MTKSKRVFLHILFWLCSGIFLVTLIGVKGGNISFTWAFVILLLPVAASTSYIFNYYLFPKYLFKKEYFKFGLYGLFLFVLSIYLEAIVVIFALAFMADNDISKMPDTAGNLPLLGLSIYFIIFLSAIIYLIKRSMHKTGSNEEVIVSQQTKSHLQVRSNRETVQLAFVDIQYIESLNDYVKIHLESKTVITKDKISKVHERLDHNFIRIHRSYIVNIEKIESFTKEKIKVKAQYLPISRTYKTTTLEKLNAVTTAIQ